MAVRIIFLGNMNNLQYNIAKRIKEKGYDVTFIVDAPKDYLLDRPEAWDKELEHAKPAWLKEKPVSNEFKAFKFSLPGIFFKDFIKILNEYDVIFLNGYWVGLGRNIKKDKLVINVLAGFDVDLADKSTLDVLLYLFYKYSTRWFIPKSIARHFYCRIIKYQYEGLARADVINYFSTGVNPAGDKLLAEIKGNKPYHRLELRGLDCDKFPYVEPVAKKKFVILNITRFFFIKENNANKRNDVMIRGIGRFVKENKIKEGLEIIFFEKGDDVDCAKKMCEEVGIAQFVNWQKEVPAEELKNFFAYCDVAFDQLGEQWVGSGFYSMLTGRPLIANGRPDLYAHIMTEPSPICQATEEAQVSKWLTKLFLNRNLVKEIGVKSRAFLLKYYSNETTVDYFIERIKEFETNRKLEKITRKTHLKYAP